MIALALGLVVGVGTALLLGKLKGRVHELTMALYTPVFTYLIADGFYGGWRGNVFISTPLGDFTPEELIGIQTFLALLATITYVQFRGRKSLTIDEFPSTSALFWVMLGTGIALSSSALPALVLPGLMLYAIIVLLSERDPFGWLKAESCSGELGELAKSLRFECLTDRESLSVYRIKRHFILGGKVLSDFPRWRELVKCLAELPEAGKKLRAFGYALNLLPVPVGITMGEGLLTALVLTILVLPLYFGGPIISVKRTKTNIPEGCKGVMEEYAEFFRKNKKRGKLDVVID
ncbi:hypothetical protein E3E38_10505 [Thermococcus sp. 18S1]|uniref:hypothetical protein n=1 Tax=Thermococcus sp. 18S1 TaxID=1638210 RepID=UPI00143A7D01|nr:hypothetical protein [Thermococcus sp. 18S1]NJE31473.1 hypothetical protein [Thermococcus sp. 18S1]